MTDKITPSIPTPLHRGGQATAEVGTDDDEQRMTAAGERALKFAQKAMREGKAGWVTDGVSVAIIER